MLLTAIKMCVFFSLMKLYKDALVGR